MELCRPIGWMPSLFNIDIDLGLKSEEASSKVSDAGYSLSPIPIETIWGMPATFATLGFLCWLDRVLLTGGVGSTEDVVF